MHARSENVMNKDDVKPPNKKRMIVRFVMNAALILLLTTQYLNHTGFCYAEMKYLSDREIVDNFLFGDQAKDLTFDQKVALTAEKYKGGAYPDCCSFEGPYKGKVLHPGYEYELSAMLLGVQHNEILAYFPKEGVKKYLSEKTDDPFRLSLFAVDQCGNNDGLWRQYPIDSDLYRIHLRKIKAKWEGGDHGNN